MKPGRRLSALSLSPSFSSCPRLYSGRPSSPTPADGHLPRLRPTAAVAGALHGSGSPATGRCTRASRLPRRRQVSAVLPPRLHVQPPRAGAPTRRSGHRAPVVLPTRASPTRRKMTPVPLLGILPARSFNGETAAGETAASKTQSTISALPAPPPTTRSDSGEDINAVVAEAPHHIR